jgi:transposase
MGAWGSFTRQLPRNGMSRSLRKGETVSHEEDDAAPHRGSTLQTVQSRDDDRYRPWRCLEPLLHAQPGRRSGRSRPLQNHAEGDREVVTDLPPTRVAMEAGVHSIWISEQLQELGHDVIVANVRELRAISHSDRKSDQVDAETLARYARLDPNILRPISHRTVEQQQALTLIRARELLVRLRTAAVNAVRGLTKACGYRMPASSTRCFAQRGQAVMPPALKLALDPVLEQIAEMTVKIKQYDREIQRMTQTEYAETQPLLTIQGVGHITALTFVLTLGDKERFGRSRDVGCYLGLRPRRSQSGEHDPQLGITKAGNAYLRSLLIECANHILRPHGRDSALRQWGLHLAARGGKQAKSKAVVAVARKLAVLLHRIWTTQESYMPFHAAAA